MLAGYEEFKRMNKGQKGAHEPKAQMAGAYPSFISMKHLGVLLPPLGQDASSSQGYPPAVCRRYPFKHLGEAVSYTHLTLPTIYSV